MSNQTTIGKQEVDVISNLAAISVAEDEVPQVAAKLSNILELFSQMESVDTDGVAPMSHPLDQVQRLRVDEVTETSIREKVMKIAPAAENGMFLVPQVID